MMAEKLAEIKARVTPGYLGLSSEDAAWLVAEVERLRADAALGAAVRKLSTAPWFKDGPGGPCLVYCFDWRGEDCPEGSAECEDDCDELCFDHPVLLGWSVTDIYYAEGVPEYITWHATPDDALRAAGLMEPADAF